MLHSASCTRVLACWLVALLMIGLRPVRTAEATKQGFAKSVEEASPFTDVFAALDESARKAWANDWDPKRTIDATIESLSQLDVQLNIEVRLVCFNGQGAEKIVLSEKTLAQHLKALAGNLTTAVLHPSPRHLAISPRVSYTVTAAPPLLCNTLTSALASAIGSEPGTLRSLVHYTVADDIVGHDAAARRSSAALTLYVLNPASASYANNPYAYYYTWDRNRASSSSGGACSGTLWAGSRDESRYAWVDLSAGPVHYGPTTSFSQGTVFDHSLPRLSHYRHGAAELALPPDLAALAALSAQQLAWPPLHHSMLRYAGRLEVHIIHMHDTLAQTGRGYAIDTAFLSAQLEGLAQGAMGVSVRESWLSWAECDVCAAAFHRALRRRTDLSRMATATAGRSGGGALPPLSDPSSARRGPAHLVTYLDSHVAHTALTEYRDDILADVESAGLHASLADSGAWVLPVFVFDLDNALTGAGSAAGADPSARLGAPLPVLLDEYEQAVAYPDMVIAVRSQVRKYDVPWVCDERRVTIDLDNLTKPLLGAVAKTAFHLADTYAYWSDATGPNANHLWSVGQGPFTPLSGQAGLPTVVADLGARNLALLHYNRSLSRVLGVVNGLRRLAKGDPKRRPQDVLPVAQLPVFRGRLAAFEFKAAQMAAALEGGRYKAAAHYAASTMHEASALVSLAQHVDATLEMGLECGGAGGAAAAAAGVPWELWLTPVVAVAMLVGAIVHRATAVPKRKEM